MNRYFIQLLLIAIIAVSCGKLDYETKEFYKQEVYIINSESTSASEREISGIEAHTFIDTLKILNDSYDTDTLRDYNTVTADIVFKIGIGGSLPASEDIHVLVDFDQSIIDDYNVLKNKNTYIPDPTKYTTNVPYNDAKKGFEVIIPKGSSSTSLIFNVIINRETMSIYADFAFPLKIKDTGKAILSRLYSDFMIAELLVGTQNTVNWSGFPIPEIPAGRYLSSMLLGNAAENLANDKRHRKYKFITPLGDTPELKGKYMIWGTGAWSFEVHGMHDAGWMFNTLTLNDEIAGTYTLDPILKGNTNFPSYTFSHGTVQKSSETNKYDPKTKTLTIYYKNVIGNDYVDVLTFDTEDLTLDPLKNGGGLAPAHFCPQSWAQVKAKGYKYWLPEGL